MKCNAMEWNHERGGRGLSNSLTPCEQLTAIASVW